MSDKLTYEELLDVMSIKDQIFRDMEQRAEAAEQRAEKLATAGFALLTACMAADAREDLCEDVDGNLMAAMREALPTCPRCAGLGSRDGMPHEDETLAPDNICPDCEGWGFTALLAAPSERAADEGER